MDRRSPAAGGFPLIVLILAGFAAGLALGEPAIGVIAGLVAGIGAALLVWRLDRRKRG
jgi:hypothetical protein